MPRTLAGARAAVGALRSVRHARSSVFLDGIDDNATFTSTAHGTGAHSLLVRLKLSKDVAASNQAALSRGTNAADAGTFLGLVNDGGARYVGGGIVGNALHHPQPASPDDWHDTMMTFAGGAGGALLVYCDGRAPLATVASPNIVSTIGRIGSIAGSAGSWFRGWVYDAIEYERVVTQAEYDTWRLTGVAPAGALHRYKGDDGYGTTLADTGSGAFNATLVGALYSPDVPFRRRRVVEDVGACPNLLVTATGIITVNHHADVDAGAGDWALMGWWWLPVALGGGIAGKIAAAGYPNVPGWLCYQDVSNQLVCIVKDGVNTRQVVAREAAPGWNHLVIERDTVLGTIRVRLNAGPGIAFETAPVGDLSNAANFCLHRTPGVSTCGVPGRSNDLVWRKGARFTWEEIEAHYYDGVTPTCPAGSVQIGWGMRETSGTVAASNPPGYNGTLSADSHTTATRSHASTAA